MKKLFHHITVSIVLLLAFSCGSDFLNEEPDFFGEGTPIIISPDWEADDYSIFCQGAGNAQFTVARAPEWLKITSSGQFVNDYAILNCKANVYGDFSETGIYHSLLILSVEGKGSLAVPVMYIAGGMDLGSPALMLQGSESGAINFGRTEKTLQLSFFNQGNGFLIWNIEGCPEWLSVSQTNGVISEHHGVTVSFTCNRELLPPGINTTTINLKSNDKNQPLLAITVIAQSDKANPEIIELAGNITDAFMDKQSDILYLTTNQPNRMIAFDTKTRTIARELQLPRAPNCFSLSEDGGKAVVGHGGYISYIDMEKFSVIKTIEVSFNVFDIEWGADNWICYTPSRDFEHFYFMQWKNIDTEKNEDTPYGLGILFGGTLIKRIPHQKYIVASRLFASPTGITIFDIQERAPVKYFHQDINKFWFSSNGRYLFSSTNEIYSTSSFFDSANVDYGNVSAINRFAISDGRFAINWIDHHADTQSVWVLASVWKDFWSEPHDEIFLFEDNDFTRKTTFDCDDLHNGRPVQAHYVFANQAGTELTVIRNATSGNFMWSLEFIRVAN